MILLSGVTGFLGSHLLNDLNRSYKVIAVSGPSGYPGLINTKVFRPTEIDLIQDNIHTVIHAHAAISSGIAQADDKKLFDANVVFTKQLLNKFPAAYHIYISTVSIYGNQGLEITENSQIQPATPYAVSKLWAEITVLAGGTNSIIRFPSLFGIGMKENTILPVYVNQALQNNLIKVWGNGQRKQNYLGISDAILYIKQLLTLKVAGKFLGTHSYEVSNFELAKQIGEETSSDIAFIGDDNSFSVKFNNQKTRALLGISFESDFGTELRNYIDWKRK